MQLHAYGGNMLTVQLGRTQERARSPPPSLVKDQRQARMETGGQGEPPRAEPQLNQAAAQNGENVNFYRPNAHLERTTHLEVARTYNPSLVCATGFKTE